jgi:hypothetical protein
VIEPHRATSASVRNSQVRTPTAANERRSPAALPDSSPNVTVTKAPLTVRISCAFDQVRMQQRLQRRLIAALDGRQHFTDDPVHPSILTPAAGNGTAGAPAQEAPAARSGAAERGTHP